MAPILYLLFMSLKSLLEQFLHSIVFLHAMSVLKNAGHLFPVDLTMLWIWWIVWTCYHLMCSSILCISCQPQVRCRHTSKFRYLPPACCGLGYFKSSVLFPVASFQAPREHSLPTSGDAKMGQCAQVFSASPINFKFPHRTFTQQFYQP